MQAIRDNVIIRPFPSDGISSGGIVVAGSYQTRNNKATIVSVGKGTAKRKMTYKIGQVVFNVKDAGSLVIENGETLFIVKDVDLLAIEN